MKTHLSFRRVLLPLATLLLPPIVTGATIDKADNLDNLNLASSWVGGVLPANTDIVQWSSIVTGASNVTLGADRTYAGIIITNPGGLVTLNGNRVLIGASGIDMAAATQDLTINSLITISANQPWNLAAGRTVTINNALTGSAGVPTVTGGTVILAGNTDNNTGRFTIGGTADNLGLLILAKEPSTTTVHALGSGDTALTINDFGTARLGGSGGDQIFNNSEVNINGGTFDLNGLSETIDGLIGSATGRIINPTATPVTLTIGAGNNATPTYAGVVEETNGAIAFTKIGSGVQVFSGALSHTGATTISAGAVRFEGSSFLANGNLVLNGGNIQATTTSNAIYTNLTIGSGAGQVRWAGSGGFSANGAPITFNVNAGVPLSWASQDFVPSGSSLQFGGAQSTHTATLPNALNLGGSAAANGTIRSFNAQESAATYEGELTGAISGSAGILSIGNGTLKLSGQLSHQGGTFVTNGLLAYDHENLIAPSNLSTGKIETLIGGAGGIIYAGTAPSIPTEFLANIANLGSAFTVAAPGGTTTSVDFPTNVDFTAAPTDLQDRLYLGATGQSAQATLAVVRVTGAITPANGTYRLGGGQGVLSLGVANTLTGDNDLVVRNGGVVRVENAAQNFTGTITVNGGVFELRSNNANVSTAGGIVVNGLGNLGSFAAPNGYGQSATMFNRARGGILALQALKDPTGAAIGDQLVTLRGGAINAHDSDGNAGTILVRNVLADTGYNTLAHQPQAAASTHDQLTVTNLSRNFGATVEFRSLFGPLATATGDNGNISVTNINGAAAGNSNNIIGGWAVAFENAASTATANDARNFATIGANGVDVYTQEFTTSGTALSSASATSNVLSNGSTNNTVTANNTISGNLTINSLIAESPIDVQNGALLTIASGGLILRQNQAFLQSTTAASLGRITTGLPSGELFVYGDLLTNDDHRITSLAIVDNGATPLHLIKGGNGSIHLGGSNANTFTGKVVVNSGRLLIDFRGGTGVLPSNTTNEIIVRSGGVFATGLATGVPVTVPNNVTLDGGILRNENTGGGTNAVVTYTGTITINSLPGNSASFESNNNRIHFGPAAVITGSGDLTKAGGQSIEIQTPNTTGFTGNVNITGGFIDAVGAGVLPNTNYFLTAGGINVTTTNQIIRSLAGTAGTVTGTSGGTDSFTVVQDIDTAYHGVISNTLLVKQGSGHLYLSGGSDNGSGLLQVDSGVVTMAKGSSNAIHVVGSGGLALTVNGGTVRLGGTYTDAGGGGANVPPAASPANYVDQIYYQSEVQLNGGVFDLNGVSESFDGLSGSDSAIIRNSAASTQSTLYTGQDNVGGNYAGVMEDGGGILNYVKLGTGVQTLSGPNIFTGTTEVRAGTLSVTGSLQASTVTVRTGATLIGDGPLGGLIADVGSNLAPGVAGIANLDVLGALTLDGTNVTLELNGVTPTAYDRFTASGPVTLLSDVPLTLTLGFAPQQGDSFTIVDNTGAGSILGPGLFNIGGESLSEGEFFTLGGQNAAITYQGGDGNDVVILVPEPTSAALLLLAGLGVVARRRRHA